MRWVAVPAETAIQVACYQTGTVPVFLPVSRRQSLCERWSFLAALFYSQKGKFEVNSIHQIYFRLQRGQFLRDITVSRNDTWYGFLQAGKKSSPVVRDARLTTKNPKTLYLFNHVQGKFLEYSREIVEPKLRELPPDDNLLGELKAAFKAARKAFVAAKGLNNKIMGTDNSKVKTVDLPGLDTIPGSILEETADFPDEDVFAE